MRNTEEFKRKISVLLILAMLISGQAGITVNAWAADVAGEYIEIQEESIPDDIVEAEELTDELTDGSGDISDIGTGDELQAETVSVNNEDAVDLLADETAVTTDEDVISEEPENASPAVSMNIANGMAQPFVRYSVISENYTNKGSDILRFAVYVETDLDTDLDGYNDLVQAVIQVPRAAAQQQYDAPTIFEASP